VISSRTSGDRREAYLSAQQPPPSPQARVPRADEHPWWTGRHQVPPRQGPRPSVGLIDRIRERDGFVRLRQEGKRTRIDPLWCSSVPDPTSTSPKVAFAIGRAVGPAVVRNRLRRRLRVLLAEASLPPGLYLIGATPRAAELTFDQLAERIERLRERLTTRTPAP